jgi:dTDP-4-amino-4,6-dideoxygalactose transaminase
MEDTIYLKMISINKPIVGNEEIRAVAKVLRSGLLTDKRGSGPCVTRFESAFSKYIGSRYAVAVNNGTSALHSALLAADVIPGDEVILPSLTFVATAEMIVLAGCKPVFVDIDPQTYCLDPDEIEGAITRRTRAIIPVHLFGLTANMGPIMKLARKHGLIVIEDAAQAHGAAYKGVKAGSLGDMACFSFYGSKNMTTGEGGMITTNRREYAEAAGIIRNHGEGRRYQSITLGHNYRMPEMEAILGYVQLQKLPHFIEARKQNAAFLLAELSDLRAVRVPIVPEGYEHAWYVFTLSLKRANAAKRNKVVRRIRERRIDAQVYYHTPIHKMSFYGDVSGEVKLPMTETAARQIFSLPVHPDLSKNDLNRIVSAVKDSVT